MAYFRAGTARATHEAQQITVAKTPLATFQSNVSGLYLPEILAYIQATQSGTGDPSPINPRTISGVSEVTTACNGINQWDEEWEVGAISSTTGQNSSSDSRIRAKNYIRVLPQTQYYFKSSNNFRIFYYTDAKEFITATNTVAGNYLFTTPANTYFMRFILVTDTFIPNDVSLNYPATDTDYHAYTGTTATTDLGGTYYGGYLNVQTGLLTVTHGYVDLSSLSWTYQSTWQCFYADLSGVKRPSAQNVNADIIAEKYPTSNFTAVASGTQGTAITSTSDRVVVNNGTSTDDPSGMLVYELATPQTVQLTPAQIEQLLGQNNVFCSSGDVAVKFWRID